MRRTLLIAGTLAGAITGCGARSASPHVVAARSDVSSADPQPSEIPHLLGCTPKATGATGATNLKIRPTYTRVLGPAPLVTTTSDLVCGTGVRAVGGSNVMVQYLELNYATGTEIDSSWTSGATLPFTVGQQVPTGLSKGTVGMRVGGRRLIVVPATEGYGSAGPVPGGAIAYVLDLLAVS